MTTREGYTNLEQKYLEVPLIETEVDLNDSDSVKRFGEKFRKLKKDKYIFRVSRWKPKGSDAQRRKYFALVRVICRVTGDDPKIFHEWVKKRVLAKVVRINLVGEDDTVSGSTTDLSMEEYSVLIQTIITLAEEHLDLILDAEDTIYSQQ